MEAKIKIRYNYSGFIPANISIKDDNGHSFIVHTVTHENGKWLTERDVKIHGSFQRQAAIDFDDFNPKAEQYYFIGNSAVPPEKFKLKSKIVINELSHSSGNLTLAKGTDDKGSKGSKDSDEEMAKKKEKRKGKEVCLSQSINEDMERDSQLMQTEVGHVSSRNVSKRKVSFPSPKEIFFYYNLSSAPTRKTRHAINEDRSKQSNPRKKHTSGKKSQQKTYIIKSRSNAETEIIPIQMVVDGEKDRDCNLTVDLGYISPGEFQTNCDNEDEIMHTGPEVVPETPT